MTSKKGTITASNRPLAGLLSDALQAHPQLGCFPPTRYQGSKRKLVGWIYRCLYGVQFDTVLDLFCGTCSVSYLFKVMGKQVTTNDYLRCNQLVAEALIGNNGDRLGNEVVLDLVRIEREKRPGFVQKTFDGIYYTENENRWLDQVASRLYRMPPCGERSIGYFALFQACLLKRPFGLFHRANLSMRTRDVVRGFGNKTTWDRCFSEHFWASVKQANDAVFDSGCEHKCLQCDYSKVNGSYDLVYVDPPYMPVGKNSLDYLGMYHFLEGLSEYDDWNERIDRKYKHKPYIRSDNPWHDRDRIVGAFDEILDKHRHSLVLISYRTDGTPSMQEIVRLGEKHGKKVVFSEVMAHRYVLRPGRSDEVLVLFDEATGG